jgi:hypothetical protein
MLFTAPLVTTEEFAERSGWHLRPEGLCRDNVCVPVTSSLLHDGNRLDLARVAEALGMPLVHDDQAAAWVLGPAVGNTVLAADAHAPDLVLPDVDGRPFTLSSLRERKVLLLAWASW